MWGPPPQKKRFMCKSISVLHATEFLKTKNTVNTNFNIPEFICHFFLYLEFGFSNKITMYNGFNKYW